MITITGANGFLGNNLVRLLVSRGETVRCFVRSTGDLRPLKDLPVEVVTGDVRDRKSLVQAFTGTDTVFHLAAVIAISPGRENLMTEVNVAGTRNVVEACMETGVKRLCHVSSSHALRELTGGQLLDERQPFDTEQRMVYGKTKALGSIEVLEACKGGLDAVIACPTGMLGPNDFRPSETGTSIITNAKGSLGAYVPGGYSFLDVRDVADGLTRLANLGQSGEYYLLSGERITIKAMLRLIHEIIGVRSRLIGIPGWLADGLARVLTGWSKSTGTTSLLTRDVVDTLRANPTFSSAKAAAELGFQPRPLRESLEDAIRWFSDEGLIRVQFSALQRT